jgi:hypothetical protein
MNKKIFTITCLSNSPYAERPEGSRKLSLLSVQTFGTVRKVSI